QPLRRGGDGVHPRGSGSEDAPYVLGVLELGERLERVRGREGVRRVDAIHRPKVQKAWGRRVDEVSTGPRVVVVRDPAVREAVDRVQVHAHLETGTQQLVQVGAKRLLLITGIWRDRAVFLDEARQEIRRLIIAAGDARVGLDRERVLAVQGFLVVEERARAARQVADAPDKRP